MLIQSGAVRQQSVSVLLLHLRSVLAKHDVPGGSFHPCIRSGRRR